MTPRQANANRILIWMCVLTAVNQLGSGAAADLFGADAALVVTALLLVVVSLVFWRLAPESFRPGRA